MEDFSLIDELTIIVEDATALLEHIREMEKQGSWLSEFAGVRYDPREVYDHIQAIQGHLEALNMVLYPRSAS